MLTTVKDSLTWTGQLVSIMSVIDTISSSCAILATVVQLMRRGLWTKQVIGGESICNE